METHAAAEVFEPLAGDELDQLAQDIREHGLITPIVTFKGKILDGRNRLAACEIAGIEPRFEEWEGESPTAYVLSTNMHRRHLNAGQKAIASAKAEVLFTAEARKRQATSGPGIYGGKPLEPISAEAVESRQPQARDLAAKMVGGVSHGYHSGAKQLVTEHPELAREVAQGTKTLPAALREVGKGEVVGGTARARPQPSVKDWRGEKLKEVLVPLRRYLREWDDSKKLADVSPKDARRLLAHVEDVYQELYEVRRALVDRLEGPASLYYR